VHEVQQFLGLCGYYRRYVRNYAQVAAPLNELTKLGEQFLWTEGRDTAFETLKTNLVTARILAMSQLAVLQFVSALTQLSTQC